jgi:hypothetical protein
MTPRKSPNTVSEIARKKQIGDLITHLGTSDNHLFQALNSMQDQSNQLVENVADLVLAIQNLADKAGVSSPAVPGGGGLRGDSANSGGSGGNTAPIPPKVNPGA